MQFIENEDGDYINVNAVQKIYSQQDESEEGFVVGVITAVGKEIVKSFYGDKEAYFDAETYKLELTKMLGVILDTEA